MELECRGGRAREVGGISAKNLISRKSLPHNSHHARPAIIIPARRHHRRMPSQFVNATVLPDVGNRYVYTSTSFSAHARRASIRFGTCMPRSNRMRVWSILL